MNKPWLCAAGTKLRKQINRRYPDRDEASDGWIGDKAHWARKSDHNPAPPSMVVRAIDIDANLKPGDKDESWELADALRMAAKNGDKRISYIIHRGKITSGTYTLSRWKWRKYSGANPHHSHIHVSFTKRGDHNGDAFNI